MLNTRKTHRMQASTRMLLSSVLAAVPMTLGVVATAPTANASTVTSVYSLFSQNSATAALNYAVFGLGGTNKTNVNLRAVTVNGNVAVGPDGSLSLMAPSTINGNVDMDSTATPKNPGPGTYTGTLDTSESFSSLAADVVSASTQAQNLTATQTISSNVNKATTITGTSGLNVIDINGNINLNNANLTFSGAGAQFIVNISGSVSLVGTASILAGSNVSDGNILLNLYSNSGTLNTNVGDTTDGIVLAPTASFNLDGVFNGELISGGGQIALPSNSTVNYGPACPSPFPQRCPCFVADCSAWA